MFISNLQIAHWPDHDIVELHRNDNRSVSMLLEDIQSSFLVRNNGHYTDQDYRSKYRVLDKLAASEGEYLLHCWWTLSSIAADRHPGGVRVRALQ